MGQFGDAHLTRHRIHEVALQVGARVHDERDHDGGRDRGADGADEGQRGQRRVRFLLVGVLQHHVVERRAHGEAEAEAGDDHGGAHGEEAWPGAGHKRHENRADRHADEAHREHRFHAVLVDELARHHGANAAAHAEQRDEVAARSRFHHHGVLAELREEDGAHHGDA